MQLDKRVADLLGAAPTRREAWRSVSSPDGKRLQAVVHGGLFQFSAGTHELREAIFPQRLWKKGRGNQIPWRVAIEKGESFAVRHYRGLSRLTLRSKSLVNHGSFLEYRMVWQARRGRAWLPREVKVGLNAASGEVAYYWSQRSAAVGPVTPRIDALQARQAAIRAIEGTSRSPDVSRPVLNLLPDQRLVWEVRVSTAPQQGLSIPVITLVQVDAITGKSSIDARDLPSESTEHRSGEARRARSEATASASVGPVYGSCYDAKYFDGLTSRYEASACATALTRAGYTVRTYHNTSALTAHLNYPDDAVFYFAGHSLDRYEEGQHSAVGLLFEEGGPTGDVDVLSLDIEARPATGSWTVCTESGVCRTQNGVKSYFWGTEPETYIVNLAVLQACATANSSTAADMAKALSDWGGRDEHRVPQRHPLLPQYGQQR
ncbi:MAG TPA: hypothetical protein VFX44_07765 [Solirubrobacterales bacterium]|nr:hypothetical protein [Solirubrobacterales bacterium]